MGLEYIVAFGISIALSIAAAILLRPKRDSKPLDEIPTTTARRGEWLYRAFGTQVLEPAFIWANKEFRYTTTRKVGGGKGLGGSSKQTIWHEPGFHALSTGVGVEIREIWNQDGTNILPFVVDRDTYPSGSVVDIPIGSFIVLWGERNQSVNSDIAVHTQVPSAWPDVFGLFWLHIEEGTSPNFPRLRYVCKVGCDRGLLLESEYWIGPDGINPAHVIAEILLLDYPFGVGLDNDEVDRISLEALGMLLETEGAAINMLQDRGTPADKYVQSILTEYGIVMYQREGRIYFNALRTDDQEFQLFLDSVVTKGYWPDINLAALPMTSPVFTYRSKDHKYTDKDIPLDDDAQIEAYAIQTSQREEIETATEETVARKIAARREQEVALGDNKLKMEMCREGKLYYPGTLFNDQQHPEWGKFRVLSLLPKLGTPNAEIEAVSDAYTYQIDEGDLGDDGGPSGGTSLDPAQDLMFNWFTLPPAIWSNTAIGVVRVRAHRQITKSDIYVSKSGSNYTLIGEQNQPLAGGELLTAFSGTADIPGAGPIVEDVNGDIPLLSLDLSSDTDSWNEGRQIIAIGDEIGFLQSVSAVAIATWVNNTAYALDDEIIPITPTGFRYVCTTAGTSGNSIPQWPRTLGDTVTDGSCVWECRGLKYQLNGILRGKHGTTAQTLAIGEIVAWGDYATIKPQEDILIQSGESLSVKSVPGTAAASVDPSSVSPVTKTV